MRLLEAIIDANQRAVSGDPKAGLHPKDFVDSLPLVALTCIDVRLNAILPDALGIPEEQFIWLRNAGNIITGTTSSTMRSLALACSIKGGREIAIIGHSDCKVRATSVAELTDRFQKLGVPRSSLPDNLNEFFGLFASERQNVMRGVEFTRQSPLIGPKIPVHGLLVDIQTGKLEWIVNGYDALGATVAQPAAAGPSLLDKLPAFQIGEMKFPEIKIGEIVSAVAPIVQNVVKAGVEVAQAVEARGLREALLTFGKSAMFKVVGNDKKIYGPVSGREIEQWLADERIKATSLAQKVGYKEWKPLAHFAERQAAIPTPPPVPSGLHLRKDG